MGCASSSHITQVEVIAAKKKSPSANRFPLDDDLSTADTASRDVYSDKSCWSCTAGPQEADIEAPHTILPFAPAEYERVKMLEQAVQNGGTVDLYKNLADGSFVAMKRMPNKWVTTSHSDFVQKNRGFKERPWYDIGITRFLNEHQCEFACTLEGIFRDDLNTYVVTTLADQGDLLGWSQSCTLKGAERELATRPFMEQIFPAVRWLHDHCIAHRDLSLENILLKTPSADPPHDSPLEVKIIDFGMATVSQRSSTGLYGKKSYMAPEMYCSGTYDAFLSDVFALGVVAFCTICGEFPFMSTAPRDDKMLVSVSQRGFRETFNSLKVLGAFGRTMGDLHSTELFDMLEGLLALAPDDRFSLGEVCFGGERPSVFEQDWLVRSSV